MVSAYRNSAFFDHYEERLAPVYAKKFDFLTDLNIELLNILTSTLKLDGAMKISEHYITASPDDLDLRGKKALRRGASTPAGETTLHRDDLPGLKPDFQEYTQVFHDRMAFVPGLSIIDLLFCEGPAALEFLCP